MIMSKFSVIMVYLLSIMMFFNFSNWILFWIFMEFNLICFLMVMSFDKPIYSKQESTNLMIYYFVIQSSVSILFLINFLFGDWESIFNLDFLFFLSLLFKIGLFPFFFWVYNMSESLTFISLSFLLTIQKLPLLSLLFTSSSSLLFLFLFLSFISGSIMLFYSESLVFTLISSSISYSLLFFFLFKMSFSLFLSFFLIYSVILLTILFFKFFFETLPSLSFDCLFLFSLLFLLGLPPFGLFFYKFLVSSEILNLLSFEEMVLFWIFSVLSIFGYVKSFISTFLGGLILYNSINFSLSILIYMLFIFLMFLFMLL